MNTDLLFLIVVTESSIVSKVPSERNSASIYCNSPKSVPAQTQNGDLGDQPQDSPNLDRISIAPPQSPLHISDQQHQDPKLVRTTPFERGFITGTLIRAPSTPRLPIQEKNVQEGPLRDLP